MLCNKKKEKSLTKGPIENIGSAVGVQSYLGRFEGCVSGLLVGIWPSPSITR